MLNTIGFLGCGNMGGAIARAVCKATDPQNVWLANRTAAKAEALAAELGCNTTINDEVAGRCDLIFLAVKPQMMEELLAPLRFTLAERPSRFALHEFILLFTEYLQIPCQCCRIAAHIYNPLR